MIGKLHIAWIGVAALLVLAAGDAAAQIGRPLARVVEQEDANGDGRLERDEAPISMLPWFDRADADGDGAIDSFEATQWDDRKLTGQRPGAAGPKPGAREPGAAARRQGRPQTVAEMIERLDRNGDDQLSREELPPEARDMFGRLDLDGDGFIDQVDAQRLEAARAKRDSAPQPGQRRGRTVARTVELMDTDGDGILQRREAPLAMQRNWDRYDLDGDGQVDMREALRSADPPAPGS